MAIPALRFCTHSAKLTVQYVGATALLAALAMPQQQGPCGTKNQCGTAQSQTFSINCCACNSGCWVLRCTNCWLLQPPGCTQPTHISSGTNGSCPSGPCAKCCLTENVPNGTKNCICLRCTGMTCGDTDCARAGSPGTLERAAAPAVVRSAGSAPAVSVEIINAVESPLQLLDLDVAINKESLSGLQFTFNETRHPLIAAIFTVVVTSVKGENVDFVVSFADRSWSFTRPLPARPAMSQPVIRGVDDVARIVVRCDYVHLLGLKPQGLHADSIHALLKQRRQALLAQIRDLRPRVLAADSVHDIEALLPKTEDFNHFRSFLAGQGKSGLLDEFRRVEGLIQGPLQ